MNVTVHTGQSDKRKANSCSSSYPECCGFHITQEEVGRSHAHIQRREEKENNLSQDLCPNGAHYCNYKAQISDQALRWLAKNVQKTKSSVIIIYLLSPYCNFSYLSWCCFVRSPLFPGFSLIHGWKQPWQRACLCKMHISARGGE